MGHLVITAFEHPFPVAVREISGAGGAKLEYPSKNKQPAWVQNRGYEFVPTGKLELRINGPGTPYQGQKVRETKHRSIEALLSKVFVTIEVGGREAKRAADMRQADLIQRQGRWEVAVEAAKAEHRAEQMRKSILAKAEEWRADQELSAFLAALEQRIPDMNQDQQDVAASWVDHTKANLRGATLLDELPPLRYSSPKRGELQQYLEEGFTESRPV